MAMFFCSIISAKPSGERRITESIEADTEHAAEVEMVVRFLAEHPTETITHVQAVAMP